MSDEPSRLTTAAWADDAARHWAAVADQLDAQLEPVSDLLFAAARLAPGERVLDVGCGRGSTTRHAAEAVAPDGRVVGLDVGAPLIADARSLPAHGVPIDWIVADAQRADLPANESDVVISRFGTLFFDDPVAAFANLGAATAPDGRLCMAVWKRRDRSEIMQRPLDVIAATAGPLGYPTQFPDPTTGPSSLGDGVEDLLTAGGWSDVVVAEHELAMYLAGPGPVEQAADVAMRMGTARHALADLPDAVVAAVREALVSDFGPSHDSIGVRMTGAVAIVSAGRE
jgi:SAM-dependent methyltransferase